MRMDDAKEVLAKACRKIGSQIALVQGAGGNLSVKENGAMHIKASGMPLAIVDAASGIVTVDPDRIRAHLATLPSGVRWSPHVEAAYVALLKAARIGKGGMPSLETGFHALMGYSVVHTHPLAVNAFACSRDGPRHLAELVPHAALVPYATVGVVLSERLRQHASKETVVLLNHGLITQAATLQNALEQTLRIVALLERRLAKLGIPLPGELAYDGQRSDAVRLALEQGVPIMHCFPDSAVYSPYGFVLGRTAAEGGVALRKDGTIDARRTHAPEMASQNAHAAAYVAIAASKLGGIVALPEEEIANLQRMQTELHRKRAADQNKNAAL
jgi:rhamnose utilization protein RhaD (predicted bifunctional aldolase and dehydrogenase)